MKTLLALLLAASWWHRLYEKPDADVTAGNAKAAGGDVEGALKDYDKAKERLPESSALAFDRAGALLKLGDASKAPEAATEAAQAMQNTEGALKAQAAYQYALATEQMGRGDEAVQAYAKALQLDPGDKDAKVNLELLLKSQQEKKQQQPQQQPQESKQNKQEQKDQQKDKSQGKDQQQQQQKEQSQEQQQQQQQQQQAKQEEKKQAAPEEPKPVDRSEAERLLDALRAGEKNLQVWRFAKDKKKDLRRGDVEKDW